MVEERIVDRRRQRLVGGVGGADPEIGCSEVRRQGPVAKLCTGPEAREGSNRRGPSRSEVRVESSGAGHSEVGELGGGPNSERETSPGEAVAAAATTTTTTTITAEAAAAAAATTTTTIAAAAATATTKKTPSISDCRQEEDDDCVVVYVSPVDIAM